MANGQRTTDDVQKAMATPMMQQYREARARHPGMLLLFRMGDFYELFNDDAEVAARVLGLTLTSRDKQIPMAGFPHHALEGYLRKLLHAGHRVAVCDQVEDPAVAKGLVKREVTRVVTPGTVTEDDLLDPRSANHLVTLTARGQTVGAAWVELSTGAFEAADFSWQRLADELGRLAPSECLVAEREQARFADFLRAPCPDVMLTARPDWTFESASARAALFHHFRVSTLAGFGFDDDQACLASAGAMLLYLQETLKADLGHLARLRPYRQEQFLLLDEVTRRSLELTRTLREGARAGSLLSALDRTVTTMGARLLAEWLTCPLADRARIEARLDAVAELQEAPALRQELREALQPASDLHRLAARVSTGRATPRDLGAIARTLRLLPRLKAKVTARKAALLTELEARLELCPDLREALDAGLVDDPPLSPKEGGLIKDGYNAALDEQRHIMRTGKDWLTKFQADQIRDTGIPSLKVRFNKVFGYYIEITHTHAAKVPEHYRRKGTLKNAERYYTAELKEYEEKVIDAEGKSCQLEYDLFIALREQVAAQTARLQQTAEMLATLDVLAGLAELAASRQYSRPELCDAPVLEIRDGRHPVLDQTLPPGTFVPNDASLGGDAGLILLITGPNMAGKCVAGDTLVFTDHGLCALEELRPAAAPVDEFVPLQCGVKGRHGPTLTSHFYNGGLRRTRKVRTSLGFELEGTPEHRVWVRCADGAEGWKSLDEVQPGDYVAIDRRLELWGNEVALRHDHHPGHGNTKRYRLPAELNGDLAYLMGLLLGDGVLTRELRFALINTDPELIEEFKRIVWEQFGYRVICRPADAEYAVTSTELRRYLADNGLGYHDALRKEVPVCIRRAPRQLAIAFLQGLFDTDGTTDRRYGSPGMATSSPRMARQVQMLLLNLGLIASVHVKKTRANPSYILRLYGEDAIRFHEVVGFRLARKRQRKERASAIRRPNKGGIPHLAQLLKEVQARLVAQRNKPVALKRVKSINSIFYTYIPSGRNVSYTKLGELIGYCRQSGVACAELELIQQRRYLYDKVQSVSPGEAQVYDLSVPDGNAYVAGGLVSHNSVYIRQVALLTLLAQMGSFVPARQARIGLSDRIFTRVGASDEMSRGQSTFMVEMTEAANILNNATGRSLVILDEIGRGTSTYDGVSLAWAITEYLHNVAGCRALFATHYHELAQLTETLPGLRNYNVLVREWQDEIVFLHKIAAGSADKSYGIHVARLAGMPDEVLERAREVLADLEAHHVETKQRPVPPRRRARRAAADQQPSLFADMEAPPEGDNSSGK